MTGRLRLIAVLLVAAIVSSCAAGHPGRPSATPRAADATDAPSDVPNTVGVPPTTAVDGLLTQTTVRPTATDAAFLARMKLFWRAVIDGAPPVALPAFFPLGAYLQVKAVRDPSADWQGRLVAAYDRDLLAMHSGLAVGSATFLSMEIPSAAAVWVKPGQEFNKVGYWRVYGSKVRYMLGGQVHTLRIASLISWRGQWYLVHLR